MTLSYCWGSSVNLRTTKDTLAAHREAIPLDAFPSTLRDAVLATRELGFRYLWIDALCIVQDDADDWEREAAQMKTVYANAVLNMSALASDDTAGGLFRPRDSRLVSPVPISIRMPKRYKAEQAAHKACHFVLPVHSETEVY